jgi:type I restriction enzyme S subunit
MTTSNWNTTRLGEVLVLGSGETKPADTQALPDGSRTIPVYGGNGISGFTAASFIDRTTLVIGRVGEYCGSVHLVSPPAWITDNALFVKKWNGNHSVEYFGYLLDHLNLSRLRNKGGQPLISQKPIYALEVQLPSHDEQVAIATRLATWDRGIRQLSGLIVARLRFKQGLMQQLLTGRRRFPKFDGQLWGEYHMGDLFDERSETRRTDLPLLSITADRGVVRREEIDRKDSSSEDKSLYKRIAPGDIGYNTMRMWQGVSAVSRLEGIVSPAYTICVPRPPIDAEYAGYLFKYPAMVHLFHRYSQGLVSDTLSLKFHEFAQIKVRIPGREEQRQIVAVLRGIDDELRLLNRYLGILKDQKKGLMQKLLTGQVRVKVR